jgi:methylsterol monooxygenase
MIWTYYIIFNLSYYIPSIILFIADMYKMYIRTQKIDDIMALYRKCIPTVLINASVFTWLPIYIMGSFCNLLGFEFSVLKMMFDMVASLFMADVLFYTTHKILHMKPFYQLFHKKHHELTAPIGVSALYMTVTDMYFANILPLYLPLIIVSAHPYTVILWMVLVNINTVIISHGGVKVLSDFHDNHHKYFNMNFGMNLIMDYIFDYR